MWTRRELKECAKQLLKINYWKAVLAGVILSLIGGSGVVSVVERSSSGSFDEVIGAVETDDFGLVLGIALGIVAVALLVNFIMTILIWILWRWDVKSCLFNVNTEQRRRDVSGR